MTRSWLAYLALTAAILAGCAEPAAGKAATAADSAETTAETPADTAESAPADAASAATDAPAADLTDTNFTEAESADTPTDTPVDTPLGDSPFKRPTARFEPTATAKTCHLPPQCRQRGACR